MKQFLKKRLHLAWFIAATSAGILAGTVLSLQSFTSTFAEPTWLLVAAALAFVVLAKRFILLLAMALIAGMLIGLFRGSSERLQIARYEGYYKQHTTVHGIVKGDPTLTPSRNTQLQLKDIKVLGQPLHGTVWLSTSQPLDIKRGDYVSVEGILDEGFGTHAAAMYRSEITDLKRPEPGDIGRRARDWFASKVRIAIPEPQASLGISYLLGQRQALPESLGYELKMLGLVHLVVASGFHLTLIVSFLRRPLASRSKYLATVASLSAIGGFLLISGFSTSMIRASLVTGLSLLAWYYGRKVRPVILLLFVAALTVLLQPSFIWGDLGWYLSFAAFAGVIILAPMLEHFFWSDKETGFFKRLVVASTAAQVTTFPIIAFTFEQYSPLALLANLLIQPFVAMAMLLTLVSGLAGTLTPALAEILGWPAYILLSYMTRTTSWLSTMPLAQGEITINSGTLAVCYVAVSVATLILWRTSGHGFRKPSDLVRSDLSQIGKS